LLQWWDKLALPVLNNLGEEKGLALEAKETLLGILVVDEDDELEKEDAVNTSEAVSENLLAVWLKKHQAGNADFDNEARFVEGQIQLILLSFGRKRPKVRPIPQDLGRRTNYVVGLLECDQQILRGEREPHTHFVASVRVHTSPTPASPPSPADTVVQ
jgi:hypothetical protein